LQDEAKEANLPLEKVSFEEILHAQMNESEKRQEKERLRVRFFRERGIAYVPEAVHDEIF
jgi:hypothetical protein